MAWDRAPELAANAHPVVGAQGGGALPGGRGQAGQGPGPHLRRRPQGLRRLGIKAAVEGIKDPRAVVAFVDDRRFVELTVEKAKALKKWYFYKDILEADRFINIPVAKQHSEARLTMCLKNMMGAIGGWRAASTWGCTRTSRT